LRLSTYIAIVQSVHQIQITDWMDQYRLRTERKFSRVDCSLWFWYRTLTFRRYRLYLVR